MTSPTPSLPASIREAWNEYQTTAQHYYSGNATRDQLDDARDAVEAHIGALVADAERWRALMNCERVRVLGGACLGTPEALLGIEFYARYSLVESDRIAKLNDHARQKFTDFADYLRGTPPEDTTP